MRDNAELVKCSADVNIQDKMTAGKVNLNVKNAFTTKADFKINKNGKGDVTAVVETQKTEPKHKIEIASKFTIQSPKFDVETSIIFDSNKKFNFKTENILDKQKLTTKNIAEIGDKKITFDANASVRGEWQLNGEVQANFVLKCPDGHTIDGLVKRKVLTNPKTGLAQGNMEISLNDARGDKKASFSINGNLEKYSVKSKEVVANAHLIFTNYDNKKLDVTYGIKHLVKDDHFKMLELGIVSQGDLFKSQHDVKINIDEYNKQSAKFRVNAKCSENIQLSVKGNYNLAQEGEPTTFDIETVVQAPNSQFKTFGVNANGKLLKPVAEKDGNYIAHLVLDQKQGTGQFFKLSSLLEGSRNDGNYNLILETNKMQGPLKISTTFKRDQTVNLDDGVASGKQNYSFNYEYANKFVKSSSDINFVAPNFAAVHFTIDSSFDSFNEIDAEIEMKKLDESNYAMNVKFKQHHDIHKIDSKWYHSTNKNGFDIQIALPSGKPITLVGLFEILGEKKAKLSVELENVINLDFKANAEAAYKSVDDFYILAQWSSNKLKLQDYNLNIQAQSKSIALSLKHAQGVVFSGSATYQLKKETNKSIIEGQGQVQYNGKNENVNFKLIRQMYELENDREFGFSYTLNSNFGPLNGVSTIKITNKEYNVKLSVCEEKKQCNNIQLQSLVSVDEKELDSLQHSILILIDLRQLGYPYEFEFQSKTLRKGMKFQYNLDSKILSNNNYKYQLIASVVPNNSKIQIILPNREILYSSTQQFPANGALFGHYESSNSFYFDKLNKPDDVTRVVFITDISGVQNVAINAKGNLKFEHPSTRTLSLSGKLDANRETQLIDAELVFDIFRLPEQQIVASSRTQNTVNGKGFNITTSHMVRSAGLGLQYDLSGYTAFAPELRALSAGVDMHGGANDLQGSIYLYASKDNAEASIYAMNEHILHAKTEFNHQNYAMKFDSKLQFLSQKPVAVVADLQPTFAKIVLNRPDLFDASVELKLGKNLKFNVDTAGKQLITGQIALDSTNFLQTSYQSNPDDIKLFMEKAELEIKKDTEAARENIIHRFQKLREVFGRQAQLAKESVPDFTELSKAYQNNINDIAQELESDPTLKQFAESYRKLYKELSKTAEGIAHTTAEIYKQLYENLNALYEKWEIIMNESIIPVWESLVVNINEVVGQLRIEISNYYTKISEYTLKLLERYGPELKNYTKSLNEALKPFNEFIHELSKTIIHASEEILQEIQEYIVNLPTFDAIRNELKEQFEKLKVSEKVIKWISDVFEHLHILPQTEETQEFLQKLKEYINMKLRQEPTQDEAQIEELVKLLLKALRSIYDTLELSKSVKLTNYGLDSVLPTLPYVADILNKLPALLTFRVSVFNSILNENWENILRLDFFQSWILFKDFNLKGLIADGHHIFTFDGQHFSYPGTCKFILAQDSVNNNFTVVAQLNNGKLKSIILADRDGNFLELSDTGALKFNGNFVEFPLHSVDMHAWRTYSNIWLRSSYGVEIMCTNDLKLCHVNVNGFYTSKTRGLLGNGNAEPEDDFIQVDGTIAANYVTFSNNYALGKCQTVPKRADVIEHTDLCNKIFGLDSPLALGYIFENNLPYRKACDIAVTDAAEKEKETAACTIASAYGSTLQSKEHIIMLPPQCLKCSGAAGQRDLGSEFTVKLPNKQADVVFVIDVDVSPAVLNNLVAPAVTEIRETLKTRGFNDVQISVVAYNESERYPALLTSGKGKVNYQGSIVDLQLNGPKNSNLRSLITDVVDEKNILDLYDIIERIVKHVVPQSDSKAFNLALQYPFRSGAVKSIIAIRSQPLEFGNMFKFVRAHLTEAVTNFDGAFVHLLSPVNKMSLEGVADEKLIGFNSRLVATVDGKDAKKRSKLQFENNLGIDVVLNNGGWIFNTQNFDTLNPQDKKKMLNQVTNSIADTLFKTDIVSECKCLPVLGLYAQHKCSIKSSTFLPNKKIKAT
ncbi:apolipophorins-like [Teleopsis dalmanni]|uniref:apolipophorins-like n=1 Tax=Teleopsis dalmanni TaxID=139649 RepID=UPI0018CD47FB|nr:apolipophorins-like [Teleopsis dalmanni]